MSKRERKPPFTLPPRKWEQRRESDDEADAMGQEKKRKALG